MLRRPLDVFGRTTRAAAVAVLALGCACTRTESPSTADAGARVSASKPPPGPRAPGSSYDLIARLPTCDVLHRGVSIDLGSRGAHPHRSYAVGPYDDVLDVEGGGATFARVLTRRLSYQLWLDEPTKNLTVSVRVAGRVANRMAVYLDESYLGMLRLSNDEPSIVVTPPRKKETAKGRHSVMLRFKGRVAAPKEAFADVDWIRVGPADESKRPYSAPTLDDIVTDRAIGGTPRRSLGVRAPSTVRCALRVARQSKLRTALGYWGDGKGSAEVRVLTDDEEPVVLAQKTIEGGSKAAWHPIELPLDPFAGRLVALELRATQTTRGGRVLFGDPEIVAVDPDDEKGTPPTKTVVIVMLSALDRSRVPPWGPIEKLSAFGEIARAGAAFSMYRAPTTVVGGVVASMLTGTSPRVHALEDPAARLPGRVQTLAEIVKQASGRAAMFTSVPPTFAPFGFRRAWDVFKPYSPVADIGADEPFVRAAEWLDRELEDPKRRRLVVIHARGAHPPWDLTKDEAEKLGPREYGGRLSARRGGIALAKMRARRRAARKLSELDTQRIDALSASAIAKQSEALGRLIAVLKKRGAWEDSLVMLLGDTGPGDPPSIPYDPAGPLTEDRLIVPLVVKFPGGDFAAKDVTAPVTTVDIATTVLTALELEVPTQMIGIDLHRSAAGAEPLQGRPLIATLGNGYATRWGQWLLRGEFRRRPKLCQLSVDPACVDDIFDERRIASRATWQWTHDSEHAARSAAGGDPRREPATVDEDTSSALKVWGY